MLTVIPSPADSKLFRHPHEFHRLHSPSRPHDSSNRAVSSVDRASSTHSLTDEMSGHHRGLPPPAAMTLPDPTRSTGGSSGAREYAPHLLPPPSQSQVPEDSMREWLIAKSEEDKRKQEELRLEQRKIEERMLREAYQSHVPPQLLPAMFAWIGGSPMAPQALESAQQQLVQGQQSGPPALHQQVVPGRGSPDPRQDTRVGIQYVPVQAPLAGAASGQAAPGQVLPSQSQQQTVYPSPAYQSPKSRNRSMYAAPTQYGPHSAIPQSATQGALPRLTTNEPATVAPSSYSHQQEQPSPSPSIFFHHWQPPQQGGGKDSTKTSPRNPGQDQSSPPRKRKNTLQHERAPAPTSNPPNMSPSFSVTSTGSHRSRGPGQHRPRSRASNYDPIRQERRRVQNEGSSRDSDESRSSQSRNANEQSRHVSPDPRKTES